MRKLTIQTDLGRLVISVPELYILLSGLTTSFKPILFGSMMLISVILVWSIIVVELLHPITSATLGGELMGAVSGASTKLIRSVALAFFVSLQGLIFQAAPAAIWASMVCMRPA